MMPIDSAPSRKTEPVTGAAGGELDMVPVGVIAARYQANPSPIVALPRR